MQVYNYTDKPVKFRDGEIPLDRFPFVIDKELQGWWSHNGEGLQYTQDKHDILYIIPDWNFATGEPDYVYKYFEQKTYVAETALLCVSVIAFTILIKLIAKLKTR